MSASTGEHPAAPAVEPMPLVIAEQTRKTLTDVRWLLALALGGIASVAVATVSTITYAQEAGAKAAKVETAGLATEQAALKENVRDLRAEVADVKTEVRETRSEIRELRKALQVALPKMPSADTDGGR